MVDVCLVLEGTYPKLTGGLSSWVQQLTEGLPDVTFAVAHLAQAGTPSRSAVYQPPPNVAEVREIELDGDDATRTAAVHECLPQAGLLHSLSTGMAGVVAGRAAAERNLPMVLTEHGLYWREVRFLPGVQGNYQGQNYQEVGRLDAREARELRASTLEVLAREAYSQAAAITTVCAANGRGQREAGAPAVQVIPNAVALPPRADGDRDRARSRLTVGLVARVTPIKDVTTFVRACREVADQRDDVDFVVLGPLDHDPVYSTRCRELSAKLGLAGRLRFCGEVDPETWYPRIDVLVSTSVSEGQPLVLLEGMAQGIPVVTTDVGGCAELVGTSPPRGRRSGLVVAPGSPRAAGTAILRLCADRDLRRRLGDEGRRRVGQDHRPEQLFAAYGRVYERALAPMG